MKTARLFSRREVVRGLASAPVLGTLLRTARAAAQGTSDVRLGFVYFGNGVHPSWTPAGAGTAYTLTPPLASLEPLKSQMLVLKNLTMVGAESLGHAITPAGLLTGWNLKRNCGANQDRDCLSTTPSIDQVIARRLAGSAPFDSIQLGVLSSQGKGSRIAYSDTNPVTPLPPEENPLAAYGRLVAKLVPEDPAKLQALIARRASVLDAVRRDVASLQRRVSATDRSHLDAYLSSLRTVEERLGSTVKSPATCKAPPAPTPPALVGSQHPVLLKQHLDVLSFALGCGLVRVATLQMSPGQFAAPMTWLGQTAPAHNISHYRAALGGTEGTTEAQRVAWLVQQHGYFVDNFASFAKSIQGTHGLDKFVLALLPENGDSNAHSGPNTPVVLVGTAGGRFKPGRLVDCGGRYQNDLYVSIAKAMGLADITTFGDPSLCKGELPGLTA